MWSIPTGVRLHVPRFRSRGDQTMTPFRHSHKAKPIPLREARETQTIHVSATPTTVLQHRRWGSRESSFMLLHLPSVCHSSPFYWAISTCGANISTILSTCFYCVCFCRNVRLIGGRDGSTKTIGLICYLMNNLTIHMYDECSCI